MSALAESKPAPEPANGLRALADAVLAEHRPGTDRELVAERLYDRAMATSGTVAWPGWETLSDSGRESWCQLAREAILDPTPADVRRRTRDDLLAEAVRVLTEAARLTRPVLERDEEATDVVDGHPVWRWRETGRTEPDDWPEFVTQALAGAAANIGGIETVLAGRPGSWEADGVRQLLNSTVGHAGEYLWEYRTEPLLVTLYVDEILWDLTPSPGLAYADAQSELSLRNVDVPDGTEEYERAVEELAELEDRLEEQRLADWAAYGEALKVAVLAAVPRRMPGLTAPVSVVVDLETFRPSGQRDEPDWPDLEWELIGEAIAATPLPGDGRPPLERLQSE